MSHSLSEARVTLAPNFAIVSTRQGGSPFQVYQFEGAPNQTLAEAKEFLKEKKGSVRVYLTRQMAPPLLVSWEKPVFKLRQEEVRLSKAALEYAQITGNQFRPSAWDIREASAGFGLPWLYYGSPRPILDRIKELPRLISIEPLSLAWLQAALQKHKNKSSVWIQVQDLGGELSFLVRNGRCETMVSYSGHPMLKMAEHPVIEAKKAATILIWKSDSNFTNNIDPLLGPAI